MPERVDVIVLGGGLTGLALADALGSAGFEVAVIERAPLSSLTAAPFDGRVTAIARGGQRLLETSGVWPHLEGAAAADPRHRGPRGLLADPRCTTITATSAASPWASSSRTGRSAAACSPVPASFRACGSWPRRRWPRSTSRRARVKATLADGRQVAAPLLAVCEGNILPDPRAAGNPGAAATLPADRDRLHACGTSARIMGVAVERFFPDGPFARLPMTGRPLLDRLGAGRRAGPHRAAGSTTRPSWARWPSASATIWGSSRWRAGAGTTRSC